jgi:NADP-dependent 3-hydroxy acid dehydrogenase YdfG
MKLNGAVVLVTGASSGIGAATARAASSAGARLVLLARREDRIQQLAEELGDAVAVHCDVTDQAQVEAAVGTAIEKFGRIDVLVNNAGQGLQATVDTIDPNDFRALLELNLVAPLAMMQAVLPHMRKQGAGAIVNVSSGITWSALPGSGAYAASKAALQKLSAIARVEVADDGIAVSVMYPSITETEFVGTVRGSVEDALQMEAASGLKPQSPEAVADAILDLIKSGAEQADLVPEAYGGTVKS